MKIEFSIEDIAKIQRIARYEYIKMEKLSFKEQRELIDEDTEIELGINNV